MRGFGHLDTMSCPRGGGDNANKPYLEAVAVSTSARMSRRRFLKAASATGLEAFCYSQVSGYQEGNFRIETSPEALAAFQALANDPFFS